MSPKGEAATLRWRDRRAQTPADPHRTRSRPAGARIRAGGDDRLARRAARGRADAVLCDRTGTLRPRRYPLARRRDGAVPHAFDQRPLERVGGRGARGRGPARCGYRRARPEERLAAREPVVGRTVRPDRVPATREGRAVARLVRLQPGLGRAGADAAAGGSARDRAAPRLERGREDPAGRAVVRCGPAGRARPPHGRRERLHRRPGAGDREGDPALPREGERLERHRLQLPRRPLRHRLRGPLRRDRAQRRRRARGGVQHRLGRRRRARRVQLARRHREGARLARGAARVAARRRARRSRDDAVLHLGRQRPLRRRAARLPAHRLRPPRHRLHRLPRLGALQPAQLDRGRGLADRACRSSTRPRSAAPFPAWCASGRSCRRRCPGRSTSTTRPATPSRPRPATAPTSTGRGTRGRRCRGATRT